MASFSIDDPPEHVRLFSAIINGKVRQVDKLIPLVGNLDISDERGKTPLICAICCEKEEVRTHIVRMLLRHGYDLNLQDLSGMTALMYACKEHERVDIVRIICRNRSTNVNICDHEGFTALMHAINASNTSAISILLENSINTGMDLKIRNKHSLNALELAVKLQMSECCRLLISAGAKMSSVRDQKGLQLLLEREANLKSRMSTPLSSRNLSSRNSTSLGRPISQSSSSRSVLLKLGRDTTFDRDINRLLETDDTPNNGRILSVNDQMCNDTSYRKQQQRRALTPISRSNRRVSPAVCPESPLFGHKARLPSIPSGKERYLVSNSRRYENPQDMYH